MTKSEDVKFLQNAILKQVTPKLEPNLLEIARVNHRELPISNLYAYFLNPHENHGLNRKFLNALLELIDSEVTFKNENISVQREVHTDTGKYIDIVISDDENVLIIENKIWADVYNPMPDYINHYKGRNPVAIILANYKSGGDYQNIIHQELAEKFQNQNINYKEGLSERQKANVDTFLETLKSYKMTFEKIQNFTEFLKANSTQIANLRSKIKEYRHYVSTVLAEQLSEKTGISKTKPNEDYSVTVNFKDKPNLILYIYLNDDKLTELVAALWIKDDRAKVRTWLQNDDYQPLKDEFTEKGFFVNSNPNPKGNTWVLTFSKHYDFEIKDNKLDFNSLTTALEKGWQQIAQKLQPTT